MPVKIELSLSDARYDALKELLSTSATALTAEVRMLYETLHTTIDVTQQNNIQTYINKSMLQIVVIDYMLKNMPERPKIITPHGNT